MRSFTECVNPIKEGILMITKVGNNVFDYDKIEAAAPKEEPARQ